ncbi:MAG: Smr/MutS family protein [bacterium]|nr:Smr/MutS family protein [bacterium]
MADDIMSEEDKALFREHMRSVKPLNEQTKREKQRVVPPTPQKKKFVPIIASPKKEYFLSDFIDDTVLSHTLLSYSHPSLPTKRFRALKNGQIPWEGRLDMHGLKAEEARNALCHFIEKQAQADKRCVLIIHGKGGHEGAPPVVKNLVNRWLPQLEEVLAFHSAQAKDGGHGAVYVLLKRNR